MNSDRWQSTSNISAMLRFISQRISARKFRLFCCGCLRSELVWPFLVSRSSRRAVETAMRFADGLADKGDLQQVQRPAGNVSFQVQLQDNLPAIQAAGLAYNVTYSDKYLMSALRRGWVMPNLSLGGKENEVYARLLRDVVGDPFQPPSLEPAWCTDTVHSIATKIYDDMDFSEMPILADALEEAGCDEQPILDHCRLDDSHVRGCWVLDMILGKE